MRILLAEDDASQAESIKTWLEMDGYNIDWVERGDHAILALEQHQYDCVLLDRGLPKINGDAILKTLRAQQQPTPVIFITAQDSIHDRVEGLDLGANDYLVKPFSLEELSARVRSQLRQHQAQVGQYLHFANLQLDPQAKTLKQDGQPINLTAKEFQILHKLMQKPDHVVTREQLEESLYAWGDEIESNAIEVFIYQLRKKIGSQYIKTIRGLGYRMSHD
ncbi:MAG: response regulator transcription factor [Acinetobacter bohemicus]|jgi:two-component system OmpR family response regulator|uniref:Two-component system, OmpR family, response regulator n=1 Tax=Acinetobacter bohemicus TaxID=1435036 RepID=A0A1I6SHI8_9GAMM|nr:response regulator transcription factor [Acinetobacter bohemicus]KAB0653343.1 response regulator transcription factor [Acinetobacter bohemicus]CAD9194235.1 Transcriptional regulatory protein QseB [Acinetobacter bohemicus]CAD9194833.1 Transcriptional regulatory protein QseB [Acinetobacter bohemicus]SFS76431.1 two-component system, OmpR family, response regulator [Acinetobacter bohemicus]